MHLDPQQFQFMLEGAREEVYLARRDGSLAWVNEAAARSLGYTRDELLARGVTGIDPDFGPRFPEHLDRLKAGPVEAFETTHLHKDGRRVPKELRSVWLCIDGVDFVCGFGHDLTLRRRAEAELQQLTRLYGMLSGVNHAVVRVHERQALFQAICEVAIAGHFRMAWVGLLGDDHRVRAVASAGHVDGYLDGIVITDDTDDTAFGPTGVAMRTGQLDLCADIAGETRMLPWREKALARGYLAMVSVPFRIDGHLAGTLSLYAPQPAFFSHAECELLRQVGEALSFALDAMDGSKQRATLEVKLAQSQKLESIGRLAGGVAHDFNNMLTVILGGVEQALAVVLPGSEARPELEEVLDAAHRSAELTRQLLSFARKQPSSPQVLDLNAAIEGTLKMLRRLIGEGITITFSPAPTPPVLLDPSHLDQLLTNLVANARDAMGTGGHVTLTTGMATLDEAAATQRELKPGPYAVISLKDEGPGMAPGVLEHVFEPFFTTKAPGQGTGLGLTTVYGLVRQAHGCIEVDTEPGQGCTFTVHFPAASPEAGRPTGHEPELKRGTATVLLVENEPSLLRVAKSMLERLGYRVLTASAPSEALALADTPFDLLLTDVVLPEFGGDELARRLRAARPELRCLFMSGSPRAEGEQPFLAKPFSLVALATAVHGALG